MESGTGNAIVGTEATTNGGHAVEGQEAAPQAPAMTPSQSKAAELAKGLFAKGASGGTLTPKEMHDLDQFSRWSKGLTHLEPLACRIEAPEDHRVASSERDTFESQHKPITEQQRAHFEQHARVNGASPQWAEAISWTVSGLQLPEAESKTVVSRMARHARAGMLTETFEPLSAEEHAELGAEALRLCGNDSAKLQRYVEGAKAYIARFPEVEAALLKNGAYESSLSYDVTLMLALWSSNERMKAKGRK